MNFIINSEEIRVPTNCPYPNLFLEILLTNAGHIDTYCKYANITNNVMINVLNGCDTLKENEKQGIINCYWNNHINPIYDYMFNIHTSVYDLKKPKHYHKFQILFSELHKLIESPRVRSNVLYKYEYHEFDYFKHKRYVTRAEYNQLIGLCKFFEIITKPKEVRIR